MKKAIVPYGIILVFLLSSMLGCVASPTPSPEETAQQFLMDQSEGLSEKQDAVETDNTKTVGQLPVRYQRPAYMLGRPTVSSDNGKLGEFTLPVGADISTPSGPKPLGIILGQIVAMKNMGISYATDVNQNALITVNVRADQDFFKAIENILRPLDYYYELDDNSIIIKHKETKTYHIAMPFLNSTYTTGVGGNVLGSTENNQMNGTLKIDSSGNTFDVWTNIRTNLDKILEIWTARTSLDATSEMDVEQKRMVTGQQRQVEPTTLQPQDTGLTSEGNAVDDDIDLFSAAMNTQTGKGYYTIDKPIGLISVTAPRSLLVKIDNYLNNLKTELYKQVSIEAKIIEVTLSEDNSTGINWSDLLENATNPLNFAVDFGQIDNLFLADQDPTHHARVLTLSGLNFNLAIDAMKQQGHVEVLSNPKISVMNGQPAMISVGENVTYVDSVESTSDEGVVSYTINTSSVMSGLGLGVIATILENDEIILSITPVTTSLTQPIEYKNFGVNQVGLPVVNLREMNTLVRVKDGEMLIVGGLIDQQSTYGNNKVAGLGDIPFAGKLFRTDGKNSAKKELIVLMRPKIISF